jgi:hypothetical protein
MHAYVGDEAIATWRVAKDPTRNVRCVACFFAIERTSSGWSASRHAGATVTVRPAVMVPVRALCHRKAGRVTEIKFKRVGNFTSRNAVDVPLGSNALGGYRPLAERQKGTRKRAYKVAGERAESAQLRRPRPRSATGALRRFETSLKRLKCANSCRSGAAWRTGQIDPLLPFEIGLVKGPEAPESGLRLKAQRANRRSRRWPSVDARLFLP